MWQYIEIAIVDILRVIVSFIILTIYDISPQFFSLETFLKPITLGHATIMQ